MAYNTTANGERIKRELRDAGATSLGLLKFSNRYLPKVLGEDEHIKAVAYGRYRESSNGAKWNWEEATLVATDSRVLFVDRKPAFLRAESIPYEAVSGVQAVKAWPFSAVTVLSRVGTFSLRYVRMSQADKFTDYVEERSH